MTKWKYACKINGRNQLVIIFIIHRCILVLSHHPDKPHCNWAFTKKHNLLEEKEERVKKIYDIRCIQSIPKNQDWGYIVTRHISTWVPFLVRETRNQNVSTKCLPDIPDAMLHSVDSRVWVEQVIFSIRIIFILYHSEYYFAF